MQDSPPPRAEVAKGTREGHYAPLMPENRALGVAGLSFIFVGLLTLIAGVAISFIQTGSTPGNRGRRMT